MFPAHVGWRRPSGVGEDRKQDVREIQHPALHVAPALRGRRGSQEPAGGGFVADALMWRRPSGVGEDRKSPQPGACPSGISGGAGPPGSARIAMTAASALRAPRTMWRRPSGVGEDRNSGAWVNAATDTPMWRRPSGVGEDRNPPPGARTTVQPVAGVAPALRGGRGSQPGSRPLARAGSGWWRRPSGVGEDRNLVDPNRLRSMGKGGAGPPGSARIATRTGCVQVRARRWWRRPSGSARIATSPATPTATAASAKWRRPSGVGEDRNQDHVHSFVPGPGGGAGPPGSARIATPMR